MKKALKISGIILSVLLIAALVIFIFFPGLPTYIKVKYEYEDINRTITAFEPVYVPDSFEFHTIKDVAFKAPRDYKLSVTGNSLSSSDEKSKILITKSDTIEDAQILSEYYGEDYDIWEYYEYEAADYKKFFKAVDENFPNIYDASSDELWYIKDKLTAKDCLKLRGRNMDIFLEFAESKTKAWDMENTWKIKCSNFTAYVSEMLMRGYEDGFWTVTIYPDSSESTYYFVAIKGADEEITKQIISSIELTEE